MTSTGADRASPAPQHFVSTRWTAVLTAADPGSPQAAEALETLCRTYWYPLYAYIRRCGHSPEDAQDLAQEYFARMLDRNWIARADPEKGRFRSFLLMTLKRFLANEWDKARALKRGGGLPAVLLPLDTAETRYSQMAGRFVSPEQVYDRQWALTLLDMVLESLRREYEAAGKAALFQALKPCLTGSRESQPYRHLAESLQMSEAAVKTAVHRLREAYRAHLRREIAQTVAQPDEVEPELRHLFRVLAGA